MKNVFVHLQLVVIAGILLTSCAAAKKAKFVRKEIKQMVFENKTTLKTIERIDSARIVKYDNQQLDDKSNGFIKIYTDSLKEEIVEHIQQDSLILSKRIKHRHADSLTTRVVKLKEKAKQNLDNLGLIDNLLATNTFNQFNTASVFGPGEFIIDLGMNPTAADPFKRVVDDMLHFASRFPNRKLNGTFLVLGYADAQQISHGSALDSTLRVSMGGIDSAGSAALNKELSRLRSKSVTEVMSNVYNTKTAGKSEFSNLSVEYLPQGRGEELPNPKIKNYQADDERRRIVMVYWSILPDFN